MDIDSDAPAGSGLGGSSALVTAVVAGLAMLGGKRFDTHELARLCYAVERDNLEISGGWQDQYAAAVGGFQPVRVLENGCGDLGGASNTGHPRPIGAALDALLHREPSGGTRG